EGRLTSQTGVGAKTLAWDAKGRVKSVGAETYVYDPLDYRIGRSGGTLGARDYFLEGEHLESEYSGGALKAKYFRGSGTDELVAAWLTDTDGKLKPYLYHHDQVNSVTALSGHNGRTGQSIKYTAFGATQSTTGASPSRLKYTGREDDGAGLYYYRARYYDPAIGRFISEDPKGFDAGDVNFYAYVGNNPVNANDPSGQIAETAWDLFNIALGSYSLTTNIREHNWGWAAVDALGLSYDAVATAVPFLPAGAGAAITALRAGNSIKNSLEVGMDVAKVANVANDAARMASTVGRPTDIGRAIHSEVGTTLKSENMLSSSANNYFKGANGASGRQPDLSWGNAQRVWADLTTTGQWGKHVNDYSNKLGLGEGIPLLYEPGKGLVDTLRLTAGAGTGLSVFQFGISSAFGSESANGGFLIYPNKSNNSTTRSVYLK
ncbi:RHS repeat-associated core domain-containing protein, partial [Methylosinus sp. Sm6]|uniref:RHS repeat-associated core domain-containing protein n=1 Tax=Methylosinus sp. Sm6 TaxID=2866948 RepID=UPI001C98F350